MTAGIPPARSRSSNRYRPDGLTSARTGVRREISSKTSSGSSTPTRPARAMRWSTAFVDPPIAISTVIAFSNASRVSNVVGVSRSQRELYGPAACRLGGNRAPRVQGRDPGRAGKSEAQRLHEACHRRSRAHLHAVSAGRRQGELELRVLLLGHRAGAQLIGVAPQIASRGKRRATKTGRTHRPARHHDRGDIGARRAHELGRHRLVTAGEENDGVDRIGTDRLLDVHRHQVAIHHRRRLHERLTERHRRKLERKAARVKHTALHRRHETAQVEIAVDELTPRIADPDDRTARQGFGRESFRPEIGTMDQTAHVTRAEPCRASQSAHTRRTWRRGRPLAQDPVPAPAPAT